MPKKQSVKLTVKRLREVLAYDQKTGVFTQRLKTSQRKNVGDVVGTKANTGYLVVRIDYRDYLLHRLAWLYVHGRWPVGEVDHIDGNRQNNAIANLRESSRSQNAANSKARACNSTGIRGVSKDSRNGSYYVQVCKDYKTYRVYGFDSKEAAAQEAAALRIRLHGPFGGANVGSR